jgi:hypothetical protein
MGRASRRVVILVAIGVLAVGPGGMAATGAAAAVPTTGRASAALTVGSNGVLFGVSAVSRSDAWAVGVQSVSGVFKTLILHWDGTAWSKVKSPSPSLADAELGGVSAVSRSDAWAVGSFWNRTGTATETLILHWDGTAWTRVKSPNPSSDPPYTPANGLGGVSARSASDAWAVGGYLGNDNLSHALVLHWNGTAWRQIDSPIASRYPTDFGLTGVSAVSGSDAWAVGNYGINGADTSHALILHWNGTAWSKVKSPSPGSGTNYLEGVSAVSGSDAWAVGNYSSYYTLGTSRTLVLHWNGTAWSKINSPTPNPHDLNYLEEVSARSSSDAWAVGNYWNTTGLSRSLILHWNGSAWSKIKSPNPGPSFNHLFGVSARSGSAAWAVGNHDTAVSTGTSLILHWNGTAWANALAG